MGPIVKMNPGEAGGAGGAGGSYVGELERRRRLGRSNYNLRLIQLS